MTTIEITAVGDGGITTRWTGGVMQVAIDGEMIDANGQRWTHMGPIDATDHLTPEDLATLEAWDARRKTILMQIFEDQQAAVVAAAAEATRRSR